MDMLNIFQDYHKEREFDDTEEAVDREVDLYHLLSSTTMESKLTVR